MLPGIPAPRGGAFESGGSPTGHPSCRQAATLIVAVQSLAKKPSTALSQDAEVGVKWKVHRGVALLCGFDTPEPNGSRRATPALWLKPQRRGGKIILG